MKTIADKLHERFVAKNLQANVDDPDVSEWMEFLGRLPEARTSVEKSYNKFLCRMHYFPRYKRFIMEFLGFFADVFIIPITLFSNSSINKEEVHSGTLLLERSRAVPDFSDVVPQELFQDYENVVVIDNFNKKFGILCRETRKIWYDVVRRYPFSFFFHYWVFMELAAHSYFIKEYSPSATAVYVNERNVASPIITDLYESQNRKFISFMHGEYLLQLVQAHMKFSEYYVWDDSYVNMFRDALKCEAVFIPYKPNKLKKRWNLESFKPTYYCTYYFGDETEKTIFQIAEVFSRFEKEGKKCKIRLHPRDIVHKDLIKRVFEKEKIEIEDNKNISLEESLGRTKYAVGMQTTVLFEALTEGRKIVIDDVSDPNHFRNLQDRWYRLLKSDHILLSELINQ